MAGFSGDGGQSTAATMTGPLEVVLDASDNIFIGGGYDSVFKFGGGYNGGPGGCWRG